MPPKEEKPEFEMHEYLMHLRYRLALYQFYRMTPPANLLIELKMTECLLKMETSDVDRINIKI